MRSLDRIISDTEAGFSAGGKIYGANLVDSIK